jgi:hypothetical protein
MTSVAKPAVGRELLRELRAARNNGDQERIVELLKEIALVAPDLQGAACEIIRGDDDDGADKRESWAAGFFISSEPQPPAELVPLAVVPTSKALVVKRRKLPSLPKPDAAAMMAALLKPKAEPEPDPKEEPEPELVKAGLPAVVLPPPPLQPPKPNWDEAVAAMNTQHAIIENVGGKTVIASWEPSPIDLGRLMVVFQSKESFLLRYSNRSVWFDVPNKRGGGSHSESVALGPWWLAHRDRLQFRGVTFRPGEPKVVHVC